MFLKKQKKQTQGDDESSFSNGGRPATLPAQDYSPARQPPPSLVESKYIRFSIAH
jgi:hypothetical protein